MTLIERKIQKIGVSGSIPAGGRVTALELRASKNQQFVLLNLDIFSDTFAKISGLDITIKRVIGTIEQIINPVIDSRFCPIKLGDIFYGIRGIPAEKGTVKEGVVIPEMSSLRIEITNKLASAISYNLSLEYIEELYSE